MTEVMYSYGLKTNTEPMKSVGMRDEKSG